MHRVRSCLSRGQQQVQKPVVRVHHRGKKHLHPLNLQSWPGEGVFVTAVGQSDARQPAGSHRAHPQSGSSSPLQLPSHSPRELFYPIRHFSWSSDLEVWVQPSYLQLDGKPLRRLARGGKEGSRRKEGERLIPGAGRRGLPRFGKAVKLLFIHKPLLRDQ